MPGYCGKCKKYYNESWQEHELDCDDSINPADIQGTPENFEKERRLNNWDDDYAQEVWNKHYKGEE